MCSNGQEGGFIRDGSTQIFADPTDQDAQWSNGQEGGFIRDGYDMELDRLRNFRNNEIGKFGWIPLFYVITLFLPTYVDAVSNNQNIVLFMGIIPLLITFYLGLASPSPKN